MRKPVRPLEWWEATTLLVLRSDGPTRAVNTIYSSDPFDVIPQWGANQGTLIEYQQVKTVPTNYGSDSATTPTDISSWSTNANITATIFETSLVKTVNTTVIADQTVPADIPWWTNSAVSPNGTTINRPTSSVYVQDQATPADIPYYTTQAIAQTGPTTNRPTTAVYVQDQATPADIPLYTTQATVQSGPIVDRPTSADYLTEQLPPDDNYWWTNTAAKTTLVDGPDTARPTSATYIQDGPTPADIGWWAYAGE